MQGSWDAFFREAHPCLSDGDAELLQNAHALFLILLPRQPEVVLVFHDVSQHRPTQKHHVLAAGRVLDPDLEFLWGY